MNYKKIKILPILLLILLACDRGLTDVEIPENTNSNLKGGKSLDLSTVKLIEGVYKVGKGKGIFGEKVVIKKNRERITIFCEANACYCIMEAVSKKSDIYIEGYWRFAQEYETGLLNLKIDAANGGSDLLKGSRPPNLMINGTVNRNGSTMQVDFEYLNGLKPDTTFYIIGHRGGGRNSDRLPASENTIEMLNFSERLGVNAVEIDVQFTKDLTPVLFHDEYMSKRLINEDYFIGKISDYSYNQLKTFCTLKNGETIPTLDDALKNIVNNTNLRLVWLDIKNPEYIDKIAELQMRYLAQARNKGRDLQILIGIPDDNTLNAYLGMADYKDCPAICELDSGKFEATGAGYWAPRWTLGLQNDRVKYFKSCGKKAFVWTLDVPEFIDTFIREGFYDGILSNYPTVVVYKYYAN